MKFYVTHREVWIQVVSIEASSEEEAILNAFGLSAFRKPDKLINDSAIWYGSGLIDYESATEVEGNTVRVFQATKEYLNCVIKDEDFFVKEIKVFLGTDARTKAAIGVYLMKLYGPDSQCMSDSLPG